MDYSAEGDFNVCPWRDIMRIILLFVMFFLIVSLFSMLSNRKFGKCVPVALISSILLVYFTQFIFKTFKVGYYMLIAAALFGAVLLVIGIKKDASKAGRVIFTNGFFCFATIFLIVMIMDYQRAFRSWDEFSHWGMMTKEMVRLDGWYTQGASRLLVHKDYPPFGSIFETMWCYFLGGFSESTAYKALHVLLLSLLTPPTADLFENKKTRKPLFRVILGIVSAFLVNIGVVGLIGSLDVLRGFVTIYKDLLMSMLFVYGLVIVGTSPMFADKTEQSQEASLGQSSWAAKLGINTGFDLFDVVSLVLVSAALVLTKQMGLALDVVIWAYFILRKITCDTLPMKKRIISSGISIGAMAVFTVISQKIWNAYVAANGITGQFTVSMIDMDKVREMLADSYGLVPMRQVFNKYIHALVERNLASLPVNITYASSFLVVLLIIFLIWKFSDKFFTTKDAVNLAIALFCGTVGYAFAMGYTFLFIFDISEIGEMAYYERYLGAYFMAEMLALIIIAFNVMIKSANKTLTAVLSVLAGFMILANGYNLSTLVPGGLDPVPEIEARRIAGLIEANSEGQMGTYVLSQDTIKTQYYVNYFCDDAAVMLRYANVLDADYSDAQVKKDIIGMVLEGELLYIKDINENFNKAMKDVLKESGIDQLYCDHLYRIYHQEDGSVKLELVAGL